MNQYLIDTNVILRFLRGDHPQQSPKSEALFMEAAEGKSLLIVPQLVLAEVVWVLSSFYKMDRTVISETLVKLISKSGIQVDEPDLAMESLRRFSENKVDYTDCYLAARAVADDKIVASFDKDFNKFHDIRQLGFK